MTHLDPIRNGLLLSEGSGGFQFKGIPWWVVLVVTVIHTLVVWAII